ncbi:conjugative transposon protein TraM [Flavobacterium sp. LHD-85]|uniref:conjugative transposon protein TraM n=1 Tax=Flavobacterium sp. LHD-85 TaxID=3071410 RepID=UPI0027DF7228|nr:conjugative transposon protein TraM [Flavobacterium sp. LHD-85]MDQ6532132.1 conjugative transposon protein TraM [Flavobacterium sp. LHD-85]
MKENNNKKPAVRVTEGNAPAAADVLQYSEQNRFEKLKKPLILGLMGIVFAGCMYLIFKPSQDKILIEKAGLNDAVPQATGAGMPEDKGKAYEQEMLERKEQDKRNDLATLSDYWNSDNELGKEEQTHEENESAGYGAGGNTEKYGSPAVHSYRNAQNELGSFYENDNSETRELRRQLDELKEKLAEKDVPAAITASDQLALMEKSYQMAAKYLPSQQAGSESSDRNFTAAPAASEKNYFTSFIQAEKSTISSLYREPSDSTFYAPDNQNKNHGFNSAGLQEKKGAAKNSVRACVHQTQTISGEGAVRVRLLEAAKIPQHIIASGTLLTAVCKIQAGRLQLKISSIEIDGSIIPADIIIYDLDGQQGLHVPYSSEMNALTEIAGNMSQNSGTSIMMTQSAGQQAAADLSRGAVQGISGYFAKKIRTSKVTLKAGHQVLLVSKK